MSLEERLARLEALVQRLAQPEAPEATPAPAPPPAPSSARSEEPEMGHGVADLLNRHKGDDRRVVVSGVARWTAEGSSMATSVIIWDKDERVSLDQRRAAGLCQALASEARLAILCELQDGSRSTSDLTASTGLERGQLYHHLRDLFMQGLVEQPERGRYQLTGRGRVVLLMTVALAVAGPDEQVATIPEELAQPPSA